MRYHKRVIEPVIKSYMNAFPIVGITGPRQSGKSTLIQHLFKNYQYVTFDDYRMREFIAQDPIHFIETYANQVIFDEAQKAPELFDLIKIAVDKDRQNYGKFILTGSSQFMLLQKIAESLAGRIGLLSLLPLQYTEIPTVLQYSSIYKGGYPELVFRQYQFSEPWFAAYLDTYLNKDLRDIKDIGNLRDFQRLLQLLAAQTTQTLNFSNYANTLGVSVGTIKNWISVLEASYIIFLLPPFYKNYGKRITKSPKVYFYDTGLVSFLTAINTQTQYEKGPMLGALFENYIVSEILKKEKNHNTQTELFYYRTSNGDEVDLIIDHKQTQTWIEIKHSSSFTMRMVKLIQTLKKDSEKGYVLYNGETFTISNTLQALNFADYLGGIAY